ncbi:MAG: tRNA (guanosine(37)-N1)-methyltransferase TrmD [Alphaproteobacteria bacterium]|nr:tRNA (guanosine(37)-N1)-methyltransferase TrmD [Alphaproteobacteria bacterium]
MSNFQINILTLFPEMFPGSLGHSIAGKALARGDWSYDARQIRDYALDKHNTVDDTPFGGGAGMVMKADVIENALLSLPDPGRKIYLSPRGKPLTQKLVQELAATPSLTLLCGRYEGVDQRLLDAYGFEEVSIGDYVLSGGEPAALILMDACIRLLPGVMGNAETAGEESFAPETGGLLEYPHYTRPAEWTTRDGRTLGVPEVLTGGDHGKIAKWRRAQAEALTAARRPDLLRTPADQK